MRWLFPAKSPLRTLGVLAHHGWKFLRMVTIPGFLTLKHLYRRSIFLKFKNKNVIKIEINPIRPHYELNFYPIK
jgi:hypothetical protein